MVYCGGESPLRGHETGYDYDSSIITYKKSQWELRILCPDYMEPWLADMIASILVKIRYRKYSELIFTVIEKPGLKSQLHGFTPIGTNLIYIFISKKTSSVLRKVDIVNTRSKMFFELFSMLYHEIQHTRKRDDVATWAQLMEIYEIWLKNIEEESESS